MCQFKTLVHSPFGAIFQCNDCRSLVVCFGNVSLNVSPGEFADLYRKTLKCRQTYRNRVDDIHLKQIPLMKLTEDAIVVLSLSELEQLTLFLERAQHRQTINDLGDENTFSLS